MHRTERIDILLRRRCRMGLTTMESMVVLYYLTHQKQLAHRMQSHLLRKQLKYSSKAALSRSGVLSFGMWSMNRTRALYGAGSAVGGTKENQQECSLHHPNEPTRGLWLPAPACHGPVGLVLKGSSLLPRYRGRAPLSYKLQLPSDSFESLMPMKNR